MEGPKRQFHITKNRTYVITVSLRSRTFARAARSTSTRGFEYYYLAAESKLPMIYRFLSAANEHFPSGFLPQSCNCAKLLSPGEPGTTVMERVQISFTNVRGSKAAATHNFHERRCPAVCPSKIRDFFPQKISPDRVNVLLVLELAKK